MNIACNWRWLCLNGLSGNCDGRSYVISSGRLTAGKSDHLQPVTLNLSGKLKYCNNAVVICRATFEFPCIRLQVGPYLVQDLSSSQNHSSPLSNQFLSYPAIYVLAFLKVSFPSVPTNTFYMCFLRKCMNVTFCRDSWAPGAGHAASEIARGRGSSGRRRQGSWQRCGCWRRW